MRCQKDHIPNRMNRHKKLMMIMNLIPFLIEPKHWPNILWNIIHSCIALGPPTINGITKNCGHCHSCIALGPLTINGITKPADIDKLPDIAFCIFQNSCFDDYTRILNFVYRYCKYCCFPSSGCTACLNKKWCMWKCAILINYYLIFSTAFYMILKITKLALKYRLFHQICFCHSQDLFD